MSQSANVACKCQKPLPNAHGRCGYCGRVVSETVVVLGPLVTVADGGGSLDKWLDAALKAGPLPTSEPINEVTLPPSGAMADGLMEFVEKGQVAATSQATTTPADALCPQCGKPLAVVGGISVKVDQTWLHLECRVAWQHPAGSDMETYNFLQFVHRSLAEVGYAKFHPVAIHHFGDIGEFCRKNNLLWEQDLFGRKEVRLWRAGTTPQEPTGCRCGFFAAGRPGETCSKCNKTVPVFQTTTVHVTGEMVDSPKGVEIQRDGGGTLVYKVHPIEFSEAEKAAIKAELAKVKSQDFLLIPHAADTDRLAYVTSRWRDCLEVIEQTYKKHPNGVGVPQASIRGNTLYVLDWRPDNPEKIGTIKVEHVVSVDADGTVNMVGSVTDLETFASLVVGGPFPLDTLEDDE